MRSVVGATARVFGRAVVMPNLEPPVTTVAAAAAYRERIAAALPPGSRFAPLLTLYLTDNTPVAQIAEARRSGFVIGVKYYPAGATTNSDSGGYRDRARVSGAGSDAEACVAAPGSRRSDRERGRRIRSRARVRRAGADAHRSATFRNSKSCSSTSPLGRPPTSSPRPRPRRRHHHATAPAPFAQCACLPPVASARIWYCRPILKREAHRQALLKAATGGNAKFFLGTDSAPHARDGQGKRAAAAPAATPLTPHWNSTPRHSRRAGALDRLEGFASFHGADFYGLPRNRDTVTLRREAWVVPAEYAFGAQTVVPLNAGATMRLARRCVAGPP